MEAYEYKNMLELVTKYKKDDEQRSLTELLSLVELEPMENQQVVKKMLALFLAMFEDERKQG